MQQGFKFGSKKLIKSPLDHNISWFDNLDWLERLSLYLALLHSWSWDLYHNCVNYNFRCDHNFVFLTDRHQEDNMKCLILGSTGETGKSLLKQILKDETFSKIVLLNRRWVEVIILRWNIQWTILTKFYLCYLQTMGENSFMKNGKTHRAIKLYLLK